MNGAKRVLDYDEDPRPRPAVVTWQTWASIPLLVGITLCVILPLVARAIHFLSSLWK